MADYVSDLLAAERRGRVLALLQRPTVCDEWILDLGHGPEACAFMVAARWARRFGATVSIRRPEEDDPSRVWQDLLDSSVHQNLVLPDEVHSRETSSMLTIVQEDGQWEIDFAPEDDLAWRTPLSDAAPMVVPVTDKSLRLTAQQCRLVDMRAVKEFRVPSLCLMENAAVGAATIAMQMISRAHSVLIFAGGGNNGGDGLALARGLDTLGIRVHVALFRNPEQLRGDALVNYHQLTSRKSVEIHYLAERFSVIDEMLRHHELVIDGLLGTGFSGALSPTFAHIIDTVNKSGKPVLALDLPSGLDAGTGEVKEIAMICRSTVTFAAMKPGMEEPGALDYVGDCYLADIGAPRECLEGNFQK